MIYKSKGKTEFDGIERGDSLWVNSLRYEEGRTEFMETKDANQINNGDRFDVIVIGGGMAGMLTAYKLTRVGLKVVVLEADVVGNGISKNTTAKITSQHGLFYEKLLRMQGLERAKQYVKANENAIDEYESIIKEENIDCDFLRLNNYVYTLDHIEKMEKEKAAADKLGLSSILTAKVGLPFPVKTALCRENQAQFHPLKFLERLKQKVMVLEGTAVVAIHEDGKVETKRGTFHAEKIVITTHYPIINAPGYYFLKLSQERSYLLSLVDDDNPASLQVDGMYIDENKNGLTFRNYRDYLLLGGGNHRTGDKQIENYYGNLLRVAGEYYPTAAVVSIWSNQDCMTPDGIPYIGLYSKKYSNLYVATGFNMWGMSSSMVAADVITHMITNKQYEYSDVFNPRRNILKGAGKLAKDAKTIAVSFTKELLQLPGTKLKRIKRGQAGIVKIDGKRIGVYHDSKGTYYYVSTKCPHLGCSLEWNKNELTWDCPCHGSRFDYKGNLISNPASTATFMGCKRRDSNF